MYRKYSAFNFFKKPNNFSSGISGNLFFGTVLKTSEVLASVVKFKFIRYGSYLRLQKCLYNKYYL